MSDRARRVDGRRKASMELARQRLMVGLVLFGGLFLLLGARTIELGLFQPVREARAPGQQDLDIHAARADIVDRNGVVLATNLPTQSLYAEPGRILDPRDAAAQLSAILPELSRDGLLARLTSGRDFIWLKRKLTPAQQYRINALGIPGLGFRAEEERVYPDGPLASHVLGFVDVDGRGLAGVEHYFEDRLADPAQVDKPLALSLDVRVQHALLDEMRSAVEAHDAAGAAGLVMDVRSGEVVALVSLPDFDPNHGGDAADAAKFNRVTQGVYELGSTFKAFTVAMALDNRVVDLEDGYDATDPIRIARFTIRDDHPESRWLTVPEIFAYSSNIGAAKMAMDAGTPMQQDFLGRLGLLRPAPIELTEVGYPLYPENWRDIATMTISYGHGIAVSPLQLATAFAAVSNGGLLNPATLVRDPQSDRQPTRVLSEETSLKMRKLMRLTVLRGTGSQANVPGYRVGGKTGTAEKAGASGYQRKALLSSFAGIFPVEDPAYLVYVMLDEPQGTQDTLGFAGGGWVAAPVVRNVIARSAPILGVRPQREDVRPYQHAATLIAARQR